MKTIVISKVIYHNLSLSLSLSPQPPKEGKKEKKGNFVVSWISPLSLLESLWVASTFQVLDVVALVTSTCCNFYVEISFR